MQLVQVDFRGDTIEVVDNKVSVNAICRNLGIDANYQRQKIQCDESFESQFLEIEINSILQRVVCIPLSKLNGWLFSINPNKVKPEVRQKLIDYKNECFDVLFKHFNKENDSNYVPYELLYSKERECIELKRAMNRITENEKLIFNDPQTHNEVLDLIGYASRATKTIKHLGQELLEYGTNMEAKLASIQKKHANKNGVTSQCNRLPRHQEKKD